MPKPWRACKKTICCVLLLCLGLGGCASPAAEMPQGGSRPSADAHHFSCLIEQFASQQPDLDSAWFQTFRKKWNVELSLTCIPTLDFVDRMSYLLTTDDLPAIIMTNNTLTQSGVLNRAIDAGMFWDLEPYIDDYPDLAAYIGKTALENAKVNGKLVGLPRLRSLERNSILYRKDWADALHLPEPKTLNDLYEMIRAFEQDDPDGNGLDDTRGLVDCWKTWSNIGWNGIQMLTVIHGGPNGWAFENGSMQPDFLSPAWLSSLSFFRRLHHDGLLNEDFSILNAEQRRLAITTGNVGVEFCVMDDIITLSAQLHQVDPEAELAVLPLLTLTDQEAPRLNSTTGNNGLLLFTKKGNQCIATEEELRLVLSIYNDFCTPEGQDFLLNGTKGVHYLEDETGKHAVETDNGSSLLSAQQGDFVMLLPIQSYERIGGSPELLEYVHQELIRRRPYLVQDASMGLLSDTYLLKKQKLDAIIYEASMRYILEEIGEEEFLAACDAWRAAGGNDVIAEYTAQYLALHGTEGQ